MSASDMLTRINRRLPVGADSQAGGGVHFRVWAPKPREVTLVIESLDGRERCGPVVVGMQAEGNGYLSCLVPEAGAGTMYRFRLNQDDRLFPDPASRFQPEGPHGPSQVIDPSAYGWTDGGWKGPAGAGHVIYEMHIGTFTQEGTFRSAAGQLSQLAAMGITIIELMPVAEFDGSFGWGYDGVALFAPYHHYGTPDDFRHFVDVSHACGLAVILDVVYNHFGPSGCYHGQYADDWFTDRYTCEWGDAINFDGDHAAAVREFFISNAGYWIEEFHLDGLRLDATQQIFDSSARHVIDEIVERVRHSAGSRTTYIVAENEPQHAGLIRPRTEGGYGIDALWNDDFHHSAMVALQGRTEAYFTDYRGTPQEFISAVKWGYLYQGQWYLWQKKRRGTPAFGLPPQAFISFLQNHDQIANSGLGRRIQQIASPGQYRAMTALLLLGPATPMLFQGQEFGASAPFLYFADHHPELAELVASGRREFVHQFPSLAAPETQPFLPAPHDTATFSRCKLDSAERERNRETLALHQDLLKLRKEDPVLSQPRAGGVDGAVLSDSAFLLRFFGEDHEEDRLLMINLGNDLQLSPAPEPLLAPPPGMDWHILWSSEHPRYGGQGIRMLRTDDRWYLTARCAVVLAAESTAGDMDNAG